jgi:ectoine hydroxylase-related dioxygenase (phytanoyl-CoA dioxygenase family)
MGFQTPAALTAYPAHVHRLSAALTLQGAVAHSAMPLESGPTKLLPFSQTYLPGYLAASLSAFQDYFEANYVQLPLQKGDAMFFNPAVFHAAGENKTKDQHRFGNLMQIGSAYGRSIEILDRARMSAALYPCLLALQQAGVFNPREIENIIAACAEGYPFPANLDIDSPLSGMAPPSQQDLMWQALSEQWDSEHFSQALDAQTAKKRSH